MIRFTATVAIVAVSLSAISVESSLAVDAKPVAFYDANHAKLAVDPSTQGWIQANDKKHRATVRPVGEDGARAWRIEDNDDDGPEGLYYRAELTDDQQEAARLTGFVYRWRLRIPNDTGLATRAISTEVCIAVRASDAPAKTQKPNSKAVPIRLRFGLQMGRQGNLLMANVHSGSLGSIDGSLTVPNPDSFHEWSMLFDSRRGILNVFIGETLLLSTRIDHVDNGHDLVFGSRSTGIGIAEWSRVSFLIGLPKGSKIIEPPKPPFKTDVFVGGKDDYFAYRIPSLVTTLSGTLLAFCEGRKSSLADLGNNDLMLKRSSDAGKTWGPLELIHDGGDKVTIGNPTVVTDRDTKTIWLVFGRDATDVLIARSNDDGKTWSKPIDITTQVKRTEWRFYAVGPGVGIQLRYGPNKGRLVIPAYHRTTKDKSGPTTAHVFYSDDHGRSWKIGGLVGPHTCECQIVETAERSNSQPGALRLTESSPGILLNARNHWARSGGRPDLAGTRIIARSHDGGHSWTKPSFDRVLIEPTCQASTLRFSWPNVSPNGNRGSRSRILFANPANRGRSRMTIRLSYDEGHTWPISRLVDGGSAAYSCLSILPDGRIGLLYESNAYKKITFAAFDLNWLTLGRDVGK